MVAALFTRLAALRGRRALLAAFGLGALAALAMPPVHAIPVLLLAIPGLLALMQGAASWRRALVIGLAWGWGHHIVGLYWISYALLTDPWRWGWLVPIAVPGLALPIGGFIAVAVAIAWFARPGWPRVVALAGAWVLLEMLRGVAFTGFPWNLMGSVWAFAALPVQGAAWVGTYGLSLVTLLLAGLPWLGRRAMAGGAVALLALGGFGYARLLPEAPPSQAVTLLLVQGNVQQEAKWQEDQRWPIFRRYLDLTLEGARAATVPAGNRLVAVWPETASPFLLPTDAAARDYVARSLPPGGMLLAGSVRAEFDGQGQLQKLFNSLSAIGDDGALLGTYDKAHLVPFGEYMPLRGLIPIRVVQGGIDFSSGPGPVSMTPGGLPAFSPLICYEVIFPGAVTSSQRPHWLLNVTNDAWFGFSAGPHQHLAAARLRAVEEGLPLARAAQTGISAVFDARGRMLAHLGLGQRGSLAVTLPGADAPTAFARAGLWSPLIFASLAIVLAIIGSLLGAKRSTRA